MTVILLASCGGPPPPAPGPTLAPGTSRLTCPAPVERTADRVVPRRVRLVNETPDTVEVWIDRCFWHTRLAAVPPGRALQPRLPERLVAFPEGLRFHANAVRAPMEYLGVFTVPLHEAPVVEVVLSDSTRTDPASLQRVVLDEGVRSDRGGGVLVSDDAEGGYAALFARETAAILSWACGEGGRRFLTLNLSGRLEGEEVSVRLRVDGGEWEEVGRWRIQSGPTDAAVAPDDRIEPLTVRALTSEEFAFVVHEDSGSRQAHAFDLEGLGDALGGRACFRDLAAGG